jgi:hypothetical protein
MSTTTGPGRPVVRLLQRFCQLAQVLDQEIMLDAGAGDADRIDFLERILANHVARHLAGQHHQRNRIHVSGGDTGNRIGRTRAGSHQANAGLASGARIAVRRVRGTLFVAHQDMLHVRLFLQRVVNMQDCPARIAKDMFDAFVLQKLDYDFRTR